MIQVMPIGFKMLKPLTTQLCAKKDSSCIRIIMRMTLRLNCRLLRPSSRPTLTPLFPSTPTSLPRSCNPKAFKPSPNDHGTNPKAYLQTMSKMPNTSLKSSNQQRLSCPIIINLMISYQEKNKNCFN